MRVAAMAVEAAGTVEIDGRFGLVRARCVKLRLSRVAGGAGRGLHLAQVVRNAIDARMAILASEILVDAVCQGLAVDVQGLHPPGRFAHDKAHAAMALETYGDFVVFDREGASLASHSLL